MRKLLKALLILLAVLLAVVIIYVGYVMLSYDRIPDNQELEIRNPQETDLAVRLGEEYAIVTQNVGFGAYTDDFTFFMDGGVESWAKSPESVIECINAAAEEVSSLEPDFILFQEVDFDSTRSYHIDEQEILRAAFPQMAEVDAVNYHSAFLMYPLTQPHGSSNSSMVTFSSVGITGALRRSLPISTGFSKFLDLDRCYTISRVPTENGKDAAAAEVPGVLIRIAEIEPPNIEPQYSAPRKTRPAVGSNVYVTGISTAIPMVGVKPGSAPITIPITVPKSASSKLIPVNAIPKYVRISAIFRPPISICPSGR